MAFDKETSLQALLGFLASEFNLTDLNPDEPIFSAGLIDSFSLVQVAAFIADKLAVTIPTKDLTVAKVDKPRMMIDTASRYAK